MHALRGVFASGLLPWWPQTVARLALLLVVSAALHAWGLKSLSRWMSGVSPGIAAAPAKVVLRAQVRQLPAPSAPTAATAPGAPSAFPPPFIAAGPFSPGPPSPFASEPAPFLPATTNTGPRAGDSPVAGPPAPAAPVPPPAEPPKARGSELAPADAKGPLPAPTYLHATEVDRRPAPVTRIEPKYPPEAGNAEGKVVVRLLLDEEGRIDRIEIVSAEPPGLFERAALEAFGSARYQPALWRGMRVKSQITFEVKFLREDAEPAPEAPRPAAGG